MNRTSSRMVWLSALLFSACTPSMAQQPDDRNATRAVAPMSANALIEAEQNTISVFEAAAPATVFVTQKVLRQNIFTSEVYEDDSGTGSGFVWDNNGHIVTNYHVIDGGRRFEISFQNGETYAAKFVGGDPRKDIAVLRIEDPIDNVLVPIRLPPPERDNPQVGQKTIAIGNPFGLDHTLTTGVVSANNREVKGYGGVTIQGMIQTDASINPGNSGGPLLNSRGELIGMNTMIYSQSGSSAGIGFAVPVYTIRSTVTQIIENGRITQVGMGVSLVDDRTAVRAIRGPGVVIKDVIDGSPAQKAGLVGIQANRSGARVGDIIVGIEDEEIKNYDDLYTNLDGRSPGETVTLKVKRATLDSDPREVRVKLYEIPQ